MTFDAVSDHDHMSEARPDGRNHYGILFAQGDLNFRAISVADPVPLGRQILACAGLEPRDEYSLFAILPSGDFEDVRLDEPFDLRARGAERFVSFLTDRNFKLTLNDHEIEWGKPAISGLVLCRLAKPAEGDAVFLEIRGGEDRLVEPNDLVDLTAAGVERFITGPRGQRTFEIIVNARPRDVTGRQVTFDQLVQMAFPGQHAANVEFSVTYRHAWSEPHSGELGAGGLVLVKTGTIFNVHRTVQS